MFDNILRKPPYLIQALDTYCVSIHCLVPFLKGITDTYLKSRLRDLLNPMIFVFFDKGAMTLHVLFTSIFLQAMLSFLRSRAVWTATIFCL